MNTASNFVKKNTSNLFIWILSEFFDGLKLWRRIPAISVLLRNLKMLGRTLKYIFLQNSSQIMLKWTFELHNERQSHRIMLSHVFIGNCGEFYGKVAYESLSSYRSQPYDTQADGWTYKYTIDAQIFKSSDINWFDFR